MNQKRFSTALTVLVPWLQLNMNKYVMEPKKKAKQTSQNVKFAGIRIATVMSVTWLCCSKQMQNTHHRMLLELLLLLA